MRPSKMYLYERQSLPARLLGYSDCCVLLLHRPGDCVAVIFKLGLACRPQSDGSFAGMVIVKELVGCSEVAGLVLPVVVVSRDDHLVSKGQQLAPSAFQILRRGRIRQSVFSHCIVDRHVRVLRFRCFLCLSVCTYITLKAHNIKSIPRNICTRYPPRKLCNLFLFAGHNEADVFLPMLLQIIDQFVEVPLISKALHHVHIEHISKPCLADCENLFLNLLRHRCTPPIPIPALRRSWYSVRTLLLPNLR